MLAGIHPWEGRLPSSWVTREDRGEIDGPLGWDGCTPVWQRNEPLTASDEVASPLNATSVVEFSDRLEFGCVSLAGNDLTGVVDLRPASVVREQVWSVVLPAGCVLVVIALLWSAMALRRSRRRGERFLPWILTYPF